MQNSIAEIQFSDADNANSMCWFKWIKKKVSSIECDACELAVESTAATTIHRMV